MDTETEISICYEAELAEIADLDRIYYLNAAASRADRADYYRRQDQLGQIRSRLYAELSAARKKGQTIKVTRSSGRRTFIAEDFFYDRQSAYPCCSICACPRNTNNIPPKDHPVISFDHHALRK
jgi:hypothetical protein